MIIVGEVVTLREKLRWFDNRPLFGRRVLVTRSVEQGGRFTELLAAAGAEALSCPVLEVLPAADPAPLDAALANLSATDLLILTSANAVEHFIARLRAAGRDLRALAGVEIAVVGPKTGEALAAHGLVADLVPADFRAEGVLELLRERGVTGQRILYPASRTGPRAARYRAGRPRCGGRRPHRLPHPAAAAGSRTAARGAWPRGSTP